MDLSTEYLGLKLPHPLMPGASPIVDNLDMVKRFEDAGAAAITMHSLFEEQIAGEQLTTEAALSEPADSFAEALSYFPSPDAFALGPEEYLNHVRRIKEATRLPVIASLNGTTLGGWLGHAKLIEEAGADALELNVYQIPTDFDVSGTEIEDRIVGMVQTVAASVGIPLAVKLSPSYSSLPHLAKRLEEAGAKGLVLFNRFYQPDIDIEALEVTRSLAFSTSSELLLRLRWIAILAGRLRLTLAASGGVRTAVDAIKAVMAGSSAVQVVSALLRGGPDHLAILRNEVSDWLEEHEYESLRQAQGSMSLLRCPDPAAYERGNYIHILQGWRDPRHRFDPPVHT